MRDLISRQAAISIPPIPKEHRGHPTYNLDDAYENGWYDLQECIERLPSAQKWIPCSERLPSEDGRYLVTYPLLRCQDNWISVMHYGKPLDPTQDVKGKCFYYSDGEWGDVVYNNILAWMPLPKPYKGGDTE